MHSHFRSFLFASGARVAGLVGSGNAQDAICVYGKIAGNAAKVRITVPLRFNVQDELAS